MNPYGTSDTPASSMVNESTAIALPASRFPSSAASWWLEEAVTIVNSVPLMTPRVATVGAMRSGSFERINSADSPRSAIVMRMPWTVRAMAYTPNSSGVRILARTMPTTTLPRRSMIVPTRSRQRLGRLACRDLRH